jgi:hypothetical protein
MDDMLERRLADLYESARGVGVDRPREIYRRLKLVARLLREAPPLRGAGPILLWLGSHAEVRSMNLGREDVAIGRGTDCDIRLDDPRVSRRHCLIRNFDPAGSSVEVEDLGSSNGTKVNGEPLPQRGKQMLVDGDLIEMGGSAVVVAIARESPDATE